MRTVKTKREHVTAINGNKVRATTGAGGAQAKLAFNRTYQFLMDNQWVFLHPNQAPAEAGPLENHSLERGFHGGRRRRRHVAGCRDGDIGG